MKRSALTWTLVGLEVFLAVGGLYGGYSLLADPTGRGLQMPMNALSGTPFDSYLVPGLVLFAVNGVFPLVVVFATLANMPWTRYGHVAVGALLTGWMGVQVWLVGLSAVIQVVYLLLGVLILALGAANWPDVPPRRGGGRWIAHA